MFDCQFHRRRESVIFFGPNEVNNFVLYYDRKKLATTSFLQVIQNNLVSSIIYYITTIVSLYFFYYFPFNIRFKKRNFLNFHQSIDRSCPRHRYWNTFLSLSFFIKCFSFYFASIMKKSSRFFPPFDFHS